MIPCPCISVEDDVLLVSLFSFLCKKKKESSTILKLYCLGEWETLFLRFCSGLARTGREGTKAGVGRDGDREACARGTEQVRKEKDYVEIRR